MKKISESNDKSVPEAHHANKYAVIFLLIVILTFSIACSLFNSEKDESSFQQEIISMLATKDDSAPVTTEASDSPQEPVSPPEKSQDSEILPGGSGPSGYTVSAENFNCICQEVSGIVTQELRVTDQQLEIVEADGNTIVYEKIGENTYERSIMGYYILIDGDQKTKVYREDSVVITLTDHGYTISQYQGTDTSPCCIHTFTLVD
jgi:hypothetical protein